MIVFLSINYLAPSRITQSKEIWNRDRQNTVVLLQLVSRNETSLPSTYHILLEVLNVSNDIEFQNSSSRVSIIARKTLNDFPILDVVAQAVLNPVFRGNVVIRVIGAWT